MANKKFAPADNHSVMIKNGKIMLFLSINLLMQIKDLPSEKKFTEILKSTLRDSNEATIFKENSGRKFLSPSLSN